MMQVNKFVENGGRLCRTLAQSVSVRRCGPKCPKKNSPNFVVFDWEVTLDSPSLRKPHINTGIQSKMAWEGHQASSGGFGVVLGVPLQNKCS